MMKHNMITPHGGKLLLMDEAMLVHQQLETDKSIRSKHAA